MGLIFCIGKRVNPTYRDVGKVSLRAIMKTVIFCLSRFFSTDGQILAKTVESPLKIDNDVLLNKPQVIFRNVKIFLNCKNKLFSQFIMI